MAADPAQARRLAVWGDPIAHSKSPALHAAAYEVLGLDWEYGRRQVSADGFDPVLASLDGSWRGLSLTMPLKEAAFRATDRRDAHAELTGAVNTLLLGEELRGFNTDVGGIVDALAEDGVTHAGSMRLLGVGATAASALVAAADLGVDHVDARARRPERAAALQRLGERLGIRVAVHGFDAPSSAVDLTVATLPGGTVLPEETARTIAASGGVLFDAAYAPWPSALATIWPADVRVVSGLGMLLHQAVRQIRVFLHGDPLRPLEREDDVLTAMRAALDA
ncbi:shikimate dehydrogenase family protein [Microbacterium tumbae]